MNAARNQARYRLVQSCIAPKDSLIVKHVRKYPKASFDCFKLEIDSESNNKTEDDVSSSISFASSFFNSRAFKFEAYLLKAVASIYPPTSHVEGVENPKTFGAGFFQVADETKTEIIMDTGSTMTWLVTYKTPHNRIDYRLGSVVKQSNFIFRALSYPHVFYSKTLLTSGVKKHIQSTKSS